jgi:hypothetical protein
MFRTDGFLRVEPMTGPRRADFLGLDNLANAFCFYHPDRRGILFGVHPQGTLPATYPWDLWFWDVERERWQPDWILATPTAFFHGNNIPTTTVAGPLAPPSVPVTSAITVSGYTAAWTAGDVNAQTEFWQLDTTLTWVLNTTVAAGVNSVAITGDIDHSQYQWKVRHIKNGLPSAYTSAVTVLILIGVPTIRIANDPVTGFKTVTFTNQAHGTVIYGTLQQSPTGLAQWSVAFTQNNMRTGDTFAFGPTDQVTLFDYRAKATDTAWNPTDSPWSATVNG